MEIVRLEDLTEASEQLLDEACEGDADTEGLL